jgi:hypothetical protein
MSQHILFDKIYRSATFFGYLRLNSTQNIVRFIESNAMLTTVVIIDFNRLLLLIIRYNRKQIYFYINV